MFLCKAKIVSSPDNLKRPLPWPLLFEDSNGQQFSSDLWKTQTKPNFSLIKSYKNSDASNKYSYDSSQFFLERKLILNPKSCSSWMKSLEKHFH